jgi:phosphoenolpyruvate carboxykinase (ATP)
MTSINAGPATAGSLHSQGIRNPGRVHFNLSIPALIEQSIQRNEGDFSSTGALRVRTGQFTGRSPKDKYIVRDAKTDSTVDWGAVNQALTPEQFVGLHERVLAYLEGKELFVVDAFGGADPAYRLPVRVITEMAWHAAFGKTMFLRPTAEEIASHQPDFTLIFAPGFEADPKVDGTRTETCIAVDFTKRVVLICGTMYAGELKKSVFTILNYLLPDSNVFPMHCSANVSADGKTALFFGLSGTGKTTLSAHPSRGLIGDDEHGWSNQSVFNFEGGCYAKCIKLSAKNEPEIWNAIRFGSVLENVVLDPQTRVANYDSDELTENTRVAYPIDYIDNAAIPSVAGHPTHIIFLTADAFGVLPPISRLDEEQAMYHFLSGYTAKLAGTERGMGKEPSATFSSCFGAPFLPRHPREYARMLADKMRQHHAKCYLVNTGWVGGSAADGASRMSLPLTRAMVDAAISGQLDNVATKADPIFGLQVPVSCPGVPAEKLDARSMWPSGEAYDAAAKELRRKFEENYKKFQ